ncbi:hypothetical protein TcBrA4_0099170 [Trypanosoma cruzi]|nr:hypothetical protein TcBrA4_0099170 [Trypanosoma cruzi]
MVGNAPRHRTSGGRDIPTCIWTDGMEQAECVAAAACPELKLPANGRTAIIPSAVFSPCCQRSVRNSLVPLDPRPVVLRGMAAPRSCPLGSAVLRYCWDRVCALPPPQTLPDLNTATPCRPTSGWLTSSCPLLGRPARALQITGNPLCRRCCPSQTEETGPPRPPPEPPPGVSTAPPRRTTSSRSTSPCPSCSSVFSSVHNMKAHAPTHYPWHSNRCGRPRMRIVRQLHGLPNRCLTRNSLPKNVKRINEQKTDSATPQAPMTAVALQSLLCCNPHQPLSRDNPREALPHTLWECPCRWELGMRLLGSVPACTTARFGRNARHFCADGPCATYSLL